MGQVVVDHLVGLDAVKKAAYAPVGGCTVGASLSRPEALWKGESMPRNTETMLESGNRFPHLVFNVVGGGTVSLPDDLAGTWSVVLLYRGHW